MNVSVLLQIRLSISSDRRRHLLRIGTCWWGKFLQSFLRFVVLGVLVV